MSILFKLKENLKIIILTILFSYIEKREVLKNLQFEERQMLKKIKQIELKNTLLSEKLDYDYIDMLIRDKLMLGKEGETTYIINDNES